jgi:hypothetical protein
MPVLILQFLPYLFQAAAAVPQVYEFIKKTRDNMKQTGEWSQEMEDAYNKELADLKANPPPWWKVGP